MTVILFPKKWFLTRVVSDSIHDGFSSPLPRRSSRSRHTSLGSPCSFYPANKLLPYLLPSGSICTICSISCISPSYTSSHTNSFGFSETTGHNTFFGHTCLLLLFCLLIPSGAPYTTFFSDREVDFFVPAAGDCIVRGVCVFNSPPSLREQAL